MKLFKGTWESDAARLQIGPPEDYVPGEEGTKSLPQELRYRHPAFRSGVLGREGHTGREARAVPKKEDFGSGALKPTNHHPLVGQRPDHPGPASSLLALPDFPVDRNLTEKEVYTNSLLALSLSGNDYLLEEPMETDTDT